MKPFQLLLTVTMLTLTLLFTSTIQPATASSSKPAPAPVVDKRKLIQSVDVATDKVVIIFMRDKSTHPYLLDNFTRILVNNVSATTSDIKNGMQVRDFIERDFETLDSITVDKADPAPPKAK